MSTMSMWCDVLYSSSWQPEAFRQLGSVTSVRVTDGAGWRFEQCAPAPHAAPALPLSSVPTHLCEQCAVPTERVFAVYVACRCAPTDAGAGSAVEYDAIDLHAYRKWLSRAMWDDP
jgi:hypothetical protein